MTKILDTLRALGVKIVPMAFQPGEQTVLLTVTHDQLIAIVGADLVKIEDKHVIVNNKQRTPTVGFVLITPGGQIGSWVLSLMSKM